MLEQLWIWQTKLRWRDGRKSPPRCLTCESTSIVVQHTKPDGTSEPFTHPDCGGVFVCVESPLVFAWFRCNLMHRL